MADADTTSVTQQAAAGASSSSQSGLQSGNAPPPKGPRDWDEFKAWVRRELELAGRGLTHEERDALNP